MIRMDKLELLDTCTDGNIEKFHQLIQGSYDHLNILFNLCKDNIAPEHIKAVVFNSDNKESTFNVICVSKSDNIKLIKAVKKKFLITHMKPKNEYNK